MTPVHVHPGSANRPRVGIPWRTSAEEARAQSAGSARQVGKTGDYLRAVEKAGGEGVLVPLKEEAEREKLIATLDAFVLPGSPADVNPSLYRAPRHHKTHDADSNREKTDFAILAHAFASGKPVLAICYGCQSLNVCLGGTLYQDIASEIRTEIEHSKDGLPPGSRDPMHAARIEPGGELGQLAAACDIARSSAGFDAQVNTSHHQSIRDLGHGLRIAAAAPDGVIEAVEHEPHKHWVVGVQWHPERMPEDALAASLFRALIGATRAAAAHR